MKLNNLHYIREQKQRHQQLCHLQKLQTFLRRLTAYSSGFANHRGLSNSAYDRHICNTLLSGSWSEHHRREDSYCHIGALPWRIFYYICRNNHMVMGSKRVQQDEDARHFSRPRSHGMTSSIVPLLPKAILVLITFGFLYLFLRTIAGWNVIVEHFPEPTHEKTKLHPSLWNVHE